LGYQSMSIIPGDEALCSIEFGMNVLALRKCTTEEQRKVGEIGSRDRIDRADMQHYIEERRKTNYH